MSQHNLLPTLQSAYRQNHSSETATLKVVSDALDAADVGQIILLAMLNLSAAFETVDHATLLERLQRLYGIGGMVLKWIKSFISSRVQTVIFASVKSASVVLLHGVPQGSVLGPLLFNLYTADVIRIAESLNVSIHCYADGIQLYVSCFAADAPAAVARLLACNEVIDRWLGSNKLKMNPDKTKLIWLGTWQQLAKIAITPFTLHDGTVITLSTQIRSLGVILDNELTMTAQVSSVVRAFISYVRFAA